jgi:NADH dehydrogenase [ubiquinone] 1 alpha subcomplex assembly factor 3
LSKDEGVNLQITGFNRFGFVINNKIKVIGPIVMFPRTLFSWNIEDETEINENSLSLFKILEPKPDILVIGFGDKNIQVNPELHKWLLDNKIRNFEMLPTEKAINVFNFLVAEDRFTAAALIPADAFKPVDLGLRNAIERAALYTDTKHLEDNQQKKALEQERLRQLKPDEK